MKSPIFQENEIKTNKMAVKSLSVFSVALLLFSLLRVTDGVEKNDRWCSYVLAVCSVILFFVCLVVKFGHYDKPYAKHIIIIATTLLSGVVHFMYSQTAIFLIFGSILISIQYYDKKFTGRTAILTWLTYLCVISLKVILGQTSPVIATLHESQGMDIWNYPVDVFLYFAIPRTVVFAVTGNLGYWIAKNGRHLAEKQASLAVKASVIEAELSAASDIQLRAMPAPSFTTLNKGMELYAHIKPAKEVGGDFYDYFMINDHLLICMVADVSDKGLPAAMFMMKAQSAIRFALFNGKSANQTKGDKTDLEEVDLQESIREINRQLSFGNSEEMFVTLWIGCIDCRTGVGKCVNAGHLPPMICHGDGSISRIESEPQLFLGLFDEPELCDNVFRLQASDTLVLFTDGLTDARNSEDELYGEQRVAKSLARVTPSENKSFSENAVHTLVKDLEVFTEGAPQFDDITVLALHCVKTEKTVQNALTVLSDEVGITSVIDTVNQTISSLSFPEDVRRSTDVVIDEICANIAEYAYENLPKPFTVEWEAGQNFITIAFRDTGAPFNPLSLSEPDLTGNPQIGGLGIHLVKNLTDKMSYKYEKGENVLTFTKVWNG